MWLACAALCAVAPARAAGEARLEAVGWLEDAGDHLDADQVAALPEGRFRPLRGTASAGFGRAPRWIRFEVVNAGSEVEPLAVIFPFPLVERLDLLLRAPGGPWLPYQSGLAAEDGRRDLELESGAWVHRLTLAPGERRQGVLRVQTRGAGFLGLELHPRRELSRHGLTQLFTGLGLGALLVLLAVNLSFLLANRRRLDFEAWGFLAGQAGHLATASGVVSAAFDLSPGPLIGAKAALAGLSSFAGCHFLRSFLGSRARGPRLDGALALAAWLSLGAVALLPFDLVTGNVAVTVAGLVAFAVCGLASAEALLAGHRAVRLFLPGLVTFSAASIWYLLSLLGLLPPSPTVVLVETAGAALTGASISMAVAAQDWSEAGAREGRLERLVAERTATLSQAVEALRTEATERMRAEERFRLAFMTNPDPVALARLEDGVFVAVNEGFLRLHGFAQEEVLGRSALALGIWPDGVERRRVVERVRQEGLVRDAEIAVRGAGGRMRTVLLSAASVDLDGVPHLLSTARDVTEMRAAEALRTRLEADLRQAQKLEAMGRLAAGVAHDFNNLLTGISANVGMALDGLPEESPERAYLADALDVVERSAGLTRQLLSFTRRQATATRPVAVEELLRGMERLLTRLAGDAVRLEFRVADGLPVVRADPGQLEQVVLNLVVNARDAVGPGGRVVVEAGFADLPGAGQSPAGPHVRLAVRDDGVGMDEETRQRIFEPFFTTKPEGVGTGLGLATVYGIVQQHGGTVRVESAPGKGSTFEVLLPVQGSGCAAREAAAPEAAAPAA